MLTYHVTIQRELIRTQTQTITVEATDAASAYTLAVPKLDPGAWHSEPGDTIGEVYQVECHCDEGDWSHNFFTATSQPNPKPNEAEDD